MKIEFTRTLSLLSIVLFFSCCSNDKSGLDLAAVDRDIQNRILNNELLINTIESEDTYQFNFEKSSINVAKEAIDQIIESELDWKTTVILTNKKVIYVPTKKENIDRLIINTQVNPSGYNPLSAQVTINLPVLGKIKAIIHSKEHAKHPDEIHIFKGIERNKVVNILGLYPNYNNRVTLIYLDNEGNERGQSTINIKTEELDIRFLPEPKVVKAIVDKMEPGMNMVNTVGHDLTDTSIPLMVDTDGEIRWILNWDKHPILNHIATHCGLRRMKNGNYIGGDANNHLIVEVNELGELIKKWNTRDFNFTFHHDIMESKSGSILITTSNMTALVPEKDNIRVYDHAVEFNHQNGHIIKEWDFGKMLDMNRIINIYHDDSGVTLLGQSKSNWLHNNGIAEYPNGDLLCTARWQGIFKYTKSNSLMWILAPHNQWQERFNRFLLTPLDRNGDPIKDTDVLEGRKSHPDFEWSWGCHSPVVLPNGNILIFDNGYYRNFKAIPSDESEIYSRAVEYKIDEDKMTVQQVWQYGKERGRDCYAWAVSGVQYLKNRGNILFASGTGNLLSDGRDGGRVVEVDPKTQEEIFELELASGNEVTFHRTYRMTLYAEIDE